MNMSALAEEFHVTVYAPKSLTPQELADIRRVLTSKSFRGRLRQAVLSVFQSHPILQKTRVIVSR